jgi:hypothetical protein
MLQGINKLGSSVHDDGPARSKKKKRHVKIIPSSVKVENIAISF